ncbi:hypothetical protein [Rhodococcus koreensis]|uniref:hypothetical protein n=1 Tax=Rhodococcus koreensis TaxID=99653 RepID=UPI00366D375F
MTAAQQLEDLSLAESRQIGGLGDNQRQALICRGCPPRPENQRSTHSSWAFVSTSTCCCRRAGDH